MILTRRRALGLAIAAAAAPAAAQTPPEMIEPGSTGPVGQDAPPALGLRPERRPFQTRAPHAIVIELGAGAALLSRAASRAIPPASMTKMMTALLAFEALDAGRLRSDQTIVVGARAASQGGSTMGLRVGDAPTATQLIEGLVVASGNDAAVALAEALAGSEAAFADAMTARARALGLASARFRNATGFSAPGHEISVEDLARLSVLLFERHPERMAVFAQQVMRWRGIRRWNRNPALALDLRDLDAEVDGLKTGYTQAAGYCVALSARQRRSGGGARRVIAVLADLPTEAARARESERILRWALRV